MKTEREKRDKKHLKGRILRSISLILICSMILSTLIGYLYFNQVVRKQRLEEEKNRLMQVGSQIAFQAEDNRRFAQSILVDEQLQYLSGRVCSSDGRWKFFRKQLQLQGQCLSEAKIKADRTGRIHCKEGMDLFRSLL